ncbi:MAG: DUF1834 family protein [Desulfobacteraceae bacterium]|nr:DUF1834 family protein [Desulfobacteraceae bacterium]
MSAIALIEDAIIGRLSTSLPYLRTCRSLSGFLPRDEAALEETAPLTPAAFLVYKRGAYSQQLSGALDRDMVFGVIVAVRNLKGDSAVRHGAAGEKGVYDVLEDVLNSLSGQACGMAIDPLLPVSEEALTGRRDFALYEILFKTRYRFAA